MKKISIYLLMIILVMSAIGCGGGKNKGSGYTYKWGAGGGSVSGLSMKSGEEPSTPIYSGAVAPPFASVKYGTNETVGGVAIYTYLDGVPVRSNYAVDPADGSMDVAGPYSEIDIFRPIHTGISNVTATYNGETLTIPVHTYYAYTFDGLTYLDFDTMTVYPGANLAADVLFNGPNYKAPYGYQALSGAIISSIVSAPSGYYRELDFGQEYWAGYYDEVNMSIIKTSEGKHVKLRFMSWGYGGTTFCFWVSDTNGNFDL